MTPRNRVFSGLFAGLSVALAGACGTTTEPRGEAGAAGATGVAGSAGNPAHSGGSGGSPAGGAATGGNAGNSTPSAGTGGNAGVSGGVSGGSAGTSSTEGGALNGGTSSVGSGGNAPSAGAGGLAASGLEVDILPDYDNAKSNTNGIAGFITRTGVVPHLVSDYMNINGGSFSTSQAQSFVDEALAAGVKHIAISLATSDTDVSSAAQAQIAAAVSYGAQKAVSVQIRFGYEMNGNWSPSYHGGDFSIFKNTWAKVASAVHGAGGLMVWAPNVDGGGQNAYRAVLPDDHSTIDIVGLDFYHFNSSETNLTLGSGEVDKAFAGIYPLVKELNKPFVLTETAVSYFVTSGAWPTASSDEIAEKQAWLEQLTSSTLLVKYPLYRGFAWFDYNKHESDQFRDFSISQQPAEATMFSNWVTQNRARLDLGG